MVVTKGQMPQLHIKAVVAGVILARFAPAIAAPIAEGQNNAVELRVVGYHGAAFAHRQVVGRVEAERADVPDGAGFFAVPLRAQSVAGVFNQPQVVLFANVQNAVHIKHIAQRVRHKNRFGFGA